MTKWITWLLAALLLTGPCLAQTAAGDRLIIEDLQCRGNVATSCGFILGHLYLNPTDVLDEEEIQNAKLRLASLQNFASVDIYLEKGSQKGKAIVIVEVSEASSITNDWALGTSARLNYVSQFFAGRVTQQNLFGEGKLLDFTAAGVLPIDGPTRKSLVTALRYADPHLFDSKRYFAIGSVVYANSYYEDRYGNFGDNERLQFGAAIGRRLWDFSYVSVGYDYQALLDSSSGRWQTDRSFEFRTYRSRHLLQLLYGWNSEDDFYFPTRGSGFLIGVSLDFGSDREEFANFNALRFRKTWQTGSGSLWALKMSGDPGTEYRQTFGEAQLFAVSFARPLTLADSRRGRWYLELGYDPAGRRPDGKKIDEIGLKAGMRIESASLGIIDLYLIASTEARNLVQQQ